MGTGGSRIFGERAKFMASAEREPIFGIWGLYPSGVRPVAISPYGGVSAGAKPLEADELSTNEI